MRTFQCLLCERFHNDEETPTCDAFLKGIPAELWTDRISHTKPFREENELLFQPVGEILRSQ